MRRNFWRTLLCASLLMAWTGTASRLRADDDDHREHRRWRHHDRDRDDRYRDQRGWRGDRGGDWRGSRGRGYGGSRGYGADPVSRALSNLNRARSYQFVDSHERGHFDQAQRDLTRFQQNWAAGKFDKDRLDGAIENLNDLANADQVSPQDRQMFRSDVQALRNFRASGGNTYRGRPWGGF